MYCRNCGKQKELKKTGYFSEKTGKPVLKHMCVNLKCEDGCRNVTHHTNFSFWRQRCKTCGYSVQDY